MATMKCICCKVRNVTRTVIRNGKSLRFCDLCDTQKPPAKKKPKAKPAQSGAKRLSRK